MAGDGISGVGTIMGASTDIVSPEKRRKIMGRIRSMGTKPEMEIKKTLDEMGIKYVYQAKLGIGKRGRKVDFLIPDRKVVIEYRDCFWHWCVRCYGDEVPVKGGILGREWWERKLRKNRERDRELEEWLKRHGYRLIVIWRHDRDRIREILEGVLHDWG